MKTTLQWFIAMILSLIIGIMLMCVQCSFAQDWSGNIDTGIISTDGNTELFSSHIGTQAIREDYDSKLTLGVDYEYCEDDNVKEDERLYIYQSYEQDIITNKEAQGKYYYADGTHKANPSKATGLFWILDASIEYDYAENLERRVLLGPGLGVYILRNDKAYISIDGGINYIVEKYENQVLQDGLDLRFRQKFAYEITERINISEKVEYFPQIDDWDNYRLVSETEVKVGIIDSLNLKVKGVNEYCSQPVLAEHSDSMLIVSVGYEF